MTLNDDNATSYDYSSGARCIKVNVQCESKNYPTEVF